MTTLRRAVDVRDWARGPADAANVILEYGDFECPFCGRAFRELQRLKQAAADRVRFVFREFPLSQMHPHAAMAAEAAEAAGAQGKFWEMHDQLYMHQDRLDAPALLAYARDLDLDLTRFARDLQEHRYLPKVRRDFMEGVRSGVSGTPTFFFNGERWNGPYTAEAFLAAIEGRLMPDIEPMTGLAWTPGY